MTKRTLLVGIPLAFAGAACDLGGADDSGEVTIAVQQALTGQTTSAGTFTISGFVSDQGQTTEELTFGGPLTQSPVPITFRRTLTGGAGTMVIKGSATLTFTSAATATLSGTWQVESSTGRYRTGRGALSGSADFAATPPSASITYRGSMGK